MNRENFINGINCENKDRQQFQQLMNDFGKTDIEFTQGRFDPIDAVYKTKSGKIIAIELKGRNDKYEHYPTYFFEQTKYDGIKQRMSELNADYGIYVYLFSNKIYMFDIEKIVSSTQSRQRLMPRNNVTDEKVYKEVYEFNKNIAFAVFIKDNNKWKKV